MAKQFFFAHHSNCRSATIDPGIKLHDIALASHLSEDTKLKMKFAGGLRALMPESPNEPVFCRLRLFLVHLKSLLARTCQDHVSLVGDDFVRILDPGKGLTRDAIMSFPNMVSNQLEDAPAVLAISFGNEEGIRFGFFRLRHTLPFDHNKNNCAGWFAHASCPFALLRQNGRRINSCRA